MGFTTYEQFWPFYLGQHSKPRTRLIHFIGIFLAFGAIAMAVFTFEPGWLLGAPAIGYGFAWAAHMFVERNRPATFTYPLWSLRGDFHMFALWLTGRLSEELTRNRIHGRP
ncbi:MAG: DUF962 domain-containing protein [Alphaproteobacteria bacterium]|nr:DUF962 domain-containing protein [Alphaproteobacteria bacterium]